MPDGQHHAKIQNAGWLVVAPASIFAAIVYHPAMGTGIALGYFIGRYVNCDADISGMTTAEGYAINELGILGYVLVAYMTLYGIIFRRLHRSTLTHGMLISTAIRWAYLFWWLWFVPIIWYDWQLVVLFFVYFGMVLVDIPHYISDKFFDKDSSISNTF